MTTSQRQVGRLLGRITELLDDINASLLQLDGPTREKFAKNFARLYSLMNRVKTLEDANGKGEG